MGAAAGSHLARFTSTDDVHICSEAPAGDARSPARVRAGGVVAGRRGFQDLMVCTAFGLKIYRNDGGTTSTDVTASLHLGHYPGDAQMVDMNGDGKLDVVEVLGKRPHALYAPAKSAPVPPGREASRLEAAAGALGIRRARSPGRPRRSVRGLVERSTLTSGPAWAA